MLRNMTLFLLVVSSLAAIAVAADLDGRWEGKLSPPGGGDEMTIAFIFKVDGEKLAGSIESPMGTMEIANGKIKEDEFTFTVDFQGNSIIHKGKITGDVVKISVEGEMAMEFTLKRAPKK
jgi:hypothetical protein